MPRRRPGSLALLLVCLAPAVGAQDAQGPPVPVRLVGLDGSALEAELLGVDDGTYRVRLGGEPRALSATTLAEVVFLPPADATRLPGIEVTPRCEWRLDAPLWRVLGELARLSGRAIGLEPGFAGQVRLEMRDGTWRDALGSAAAGLGGGLEERGERPLVTRRAVRAPFRLVTARVLPAPQPLAPATPGPGEISWARYLVRCQEPDGRWSAVEHGRAPAAGDALATSLCTLAYLGNGHTHRYGTHKHTVDRALRWLKDWQPGDTTTSPAPVLDRALVSMALAEAYAVSRDFTLRRHAERSLQALLELRTPRGGWGLAAGDAPDAFTTSHAVLACHTATLAMLELPPGVLAEAAAFLAGLQSPDGSTGFRARGQGLSLTAGDPEQALPLPLFSAGAAFSRLCAGESGGTVGLRQLRDQLLAAPPHARRPDPAYWWLATHAVFRLGAEAWKAWEPQLLEAVLLLQREEPPELAGSWDPAGLWGQLAGRAGSTAANALALELHYRHERATAPDPPAPR